MSSHKNVLAWIVGLGLLISLSGIGYFYYVYQVDSASVVHEHTQMMAKRILELQEKLDRNGVLATEILKNNRELISINNRLLVGIEESHVKLHEELAKVAKTQKEDTVEAIAKYLQQSREMYLNEFARLREDFKVNRELHKQTQRFLKVPQEGK